MDTFIGIIALILGSIVTSIICTLSAHKDEIWGKIQFKGRE